MISQDNFKITASELKQCIKNITLLDVREQEEFNAAHIEGCKLIPLGEIMLRAEKELDKNADIVIYCAHGMRSMQALNAMKRIGFSKLRSLEGGIAVWAQENGPTLSSR